MDDPPDYQGLLESAVDNTVSVECAPDIDEPWKYQWTDITAGFLSACKDLQRGELVREERFHLSEAMSAIELMDPKMDAGMIRVDRPVGFEGAVDNGSLRISAMPHDELIATMDASFSGLVTWLEGHSLAQTVFTNLCLHRPAAIKDQSLHAFCAGILRLVAMFKRIIETAAVFEEEDFNSTNFGFDMNMFSTSQAVQLLKTAEEELQKLARRQRADDENDNSSSNSNAATLAERVSDRLRFVRCLLLAVSALVPTESGVPTSKSRPNFDEADKHLRTCEQFFDVAIESIALGTQPPDDNDGDFAWLPAFEPAVNRRLLPPTFPRKTQLSSRNQAMVYLRAVVERLHTIVLALPHKIANFDATLTFLRQFSQSGSCVLSRSILQLVYLPEDDKVLGVTSIIDILTDSMSDFVSPPVLQPGSLLLENADCRQLWSDFVADCAKVFLGLVQICGHNRARQRDKLIPSLEDLSALQAEADKVDGEFHAYLQRTDPTRHHVQTLCSFVLYHTLLVMREYFTLGFELNLFAPYEFTYVYWYASELVFKWLGNVLDRAQNFIVREYQHSSKDKSKNDRKRNFRLKKEAEMRKRIVLGQERIIYWQASQRMCEAFFKANIGLLITGKTRLPLGGGESIRFDHRMAAFSCLNTPPPIRYEQYREMSRIDALIRFGAEKCLKDAADAFDSARSHLEHLDVSASFQQEASTMAKVCKNNAVVLRLMASGHKSDSKAPPTLDFSCCSMYPLLKL